MAGAIGIALRAFVATVLSAGTNSPLIFAFANEAMHLRNAVREQLAAQRAVEEGVTEQALTRGPDFIAQHELREAHDAYAAGDFTTMTPTDLRERAAHKARDEHKAQARA
jgi:hypothetical protein